MPWLPSGWLGGRRGRMLGDFRCEHGAPPLPEPLLQVPLEVAMSAMEGRSMPTYAYALNNPIGYTDPDGLQPAPAPMPGPGPILPLLPPEMFQPHPDTHTCNDGSVWTCPKKIWGDQVCRQIHPPSAKSRWSCTASCNVQEIPGPRTPGQAPTPGRVTGTGTGSDEASACLSTKRAATQSAPPGSYARHCQCDCSKG